MASEMSPERKKKFDLLKMEIRAILVSANEGITPATLDRDYSDINGSCIPYQSFGFLTLFEFLDAIPDVVGAYRMNDGNVLLYPKSSEKTRHVESLVARQKKATRVGRFGGIINKPNEECHGTAERRQLITNRLLRLLVNQPPMFMKYNDVFVLYESKYGEKLDPRDDFCCNAKTLFDIKLSKYFDVRDTSHGAFWICLKTEEREKLLKSSNATTSRPSTPGLQQSNVSPGNKDKPPSPWKETSQSSAASVKMANPVMEKENGDTLPATRLNLNQENVGVQPQPNLAVPLPMKTTTTTNILGPNGTNATGANVNNATNFQGTNSSYSTANTSVNSCGSKSGMASMARKSPFSEDSGIGTAKSVSMASTTTTVTPPKPNPILGGQGTAEERANVSHGQQKTTQQPAKPSIQTSALEPRITGRKENPVTSTNVVPSAEFFQDHVRRLLDSYPNGIEMSILEWSYLHAFGECLFRGDNKKENHASLTSLLLKIPNICQIVLKSGVPYLVKAKAPPVYAASKHFSPADTSSKKQASADDTLTMKLRPDADRSGSACRMDEIVDDETFMGLVQLKTSLEQLKTDCKQVLRASPAGISYLNFSRAFKKIVGRDLNLHAHGFLSLYDLIDAMPDVFAVEKGYEGTVLKEAKHVPLTNARQSRAVLSNNGHCTQQPINDSPVVKEELVQSVWNVLLKQPNKSLYLDEIPAAYLKATGRSFPIKDLDEFGLVACDRIELFSSEYTGGKLRVIAETEAVV